MRMESMEAKELLKRFYSVQEERVQTYGLFDEGHEAYLKGAPNYNFPMYRQLVYEVTQTFKNISDEIITIAAKLETDFNQKQVANFIRQIQEREEKKLEYTAKRQIAKQNVLDKPQDDRYRSEVVETDESIQDCVERINEYLEELKYEAEDLMVEKE